MLEVQSHIPNNDPAQSWLDEYWTMLYVAAEIAPYTTVHKKSGVTVTVDLRGISG